MAVMAFGVVSEDLHGMGPFRLWTLRDVVGSDPEPFSDGLLTPFRGYGMEPRFWEDLEHQFRITMENRIESRMTNPSANSLPITDVYFREAVNLLCWELGPAPGVNLRKKRRIQTRLSGGTSKSLHVTFSPNASQIEIEAKDEEARAQLIWIWLYIGIVCFLI